jgi:hypothetical protein
MSEEKYVWDEDFNSFFELNPNNDYENLSKVTVARTLNEQDQKIKDLERQLEEAREVIESILHITYDSEGVAGYHNNGDTALWGEFEELAMAGHFLEQLKEKG